MYDHVSSILAFPHGHPTTSGGHTSNLTFFLIIGVPVGILILVGLVGLLSRKR